MMEIKRSGALLFQQPSQLDRRLDLHLVEDVRAVHFHRAHANAQLAGKMNKVVADELGISMRTVEVHRAHIFDKMQVKTAVELAGLLK